MINATKPVVTDVAPTGIEGLDTLLHGGLPRHHMYLLQGEAGTGKTTVGMQFLIEGVRAGETSLFIALAETREDLLEVAASHGWSLEGVDIYEVTTAEAAERLSGTQTIFPTSEVELSEVTDEIIEKLQETRPQRVLFDAVSELRLLADSPVRYRRQILALRDALAQIQATALLTDTAVKNDEDRVLDSLVHGIIRLERWAPDYGAARRRMEITKLRGSRYHEGWHDMNITTGGIEVYPRPVARARQSTQTGNSWRVACPRWTPSRAAVWRWAQRHSSWAARAQGKARWLRCMYTRPWKEASRARSLSLTSVQRHFTSVARIWVCLCGPSSRTDSSPCTRSRLGQSPPGSLADTIRALAEEQGVKIVLFDSLTGYLRAMPGESLLVQQVHDLLNYLSQKGVLSLLIVTHHGLVGGVIQHDLDLSYISDTVMLCRHFEAGGELRNAISVVKKRHGWHEKTIRELRIREGGIEVGEPLQGFRGVLTGNPEFRGEKDDLMQSETR
jgi:circadian clock protein KaiC